MESVTSSHLDSAMKKQNVTAGGGRTTYDNTHTFASRNVDVDLTDIRVHGNPSSKPSGRDYYREDSRPNRGNSEASGGRNNGGYRQSNYGHQRKTHVDISCRPDFGVYVVGAITLLVVILFYVIIVH